MVEVGTFIGIDRHHVIAVGIGLELYKLDFIRGTIFHRDAAEAAGRRPGAPGELFFSISAGILTESIHRLTGVAFEGHIDEAVVSIGCGDGGRPAHPAGSVPGTEFKGVVFQYRTDGDLAAGGQGIIGGGQPENIVRQRVGEGLCLPARGELAVPHICGAISEDQKGIAGSALKGNVKGFGRSVFDQCRGLNLISPNIAGSIPAQRKKVFAVGLGRDKDIITAGS